MQSLLDSIKNNLTTFSTTIAVIALVVLGIIAMVKFKQGAIRETLSGFGVIVLGILVISTAGAIVTTLMALGATLK